MHGKARAALASSIAAASAAACSMALDFDALSQGGATDAGRDAIADSPAAIDAADSGAPPRDAAPDVGDAPDAAVAAFCASLSPAPTFCDDFDHAVLSAVWDVVGMTNGAIEASPLAFTSGPRGLRVATNPLDAGADLWVVVDKSFPPFTGAPVHAMVAFDLRIDAMDARHEGTVFALEWPAGGGDYYNIEIEAQAINAGTAQLSIAEATPSLYDGQNFATAFPLGQWHRVSVDVSIKDLASPSGTNRMKAYVDGALQADKQILYPVKTATPRLELGTSYIRLPTAPWTFFYDDVTVTLSAP